MGVVEQWTAVVEGLDPKWHDARLELVVTDEQQLRRAAALLAPAQPGRMGSALRFTAARRGGAFVGPEAVRRMLRRIDDERIGGGPPPVSSGAGAPPAGLSPPAAPARWGAAARGAPPAPRAPA